MLKVCIHRDKKSTVVLSPNTLNWQPDKMMNDNEAKLLEVCQGAAENVYLSQWPISELDVVNWAPF